MTETPRQSDLPSGESVFPVLPLRDIVVFPHMIVPLFVGREKSINALEEVMQADKQILLATQKDAGDDDPAPEAIFEVGTLATVLQLLKLPDGTVKVLVEGRDRAQIVRYTGRQTYFEAEARLLPEIRGEEVEVEALSRSVVSEFENYVKLNKKVSPEVLSAVSNIEDYSKLADTIASHLAVRIPEKQEILALTSVVQRLEKVLGMMESEISVLQVEKRIRSRVKRQMEKTQREYYLNEQMKAIQKELGDGEDGRDELRELEDRIGKTKLSKEAREKADTELKKLRQMSPMSAEATVVRNYLDWLLGIPWGKRSKIKKDLPAAQKVLDDDHFGLDKVKERIVEYLAVRKLKGDLKGPILCFVGPPGVGKTSLGQSIARAMNRKFVRISLGGVRDEAEIRGHRRTYIGSMPGRLVQALKSAASSNPVFMLDEIDKMSSGIQGDPAAAMLEVLDPAQNHTFRDHYLEIPIDLSKVLFIATANQLGTIHPALLDRMELISLTGYTEDDKLHIAKMYLIPRQRDEHGLKPEHIEITDEAVRRVITEYTREAGVRTIERQIGAIARKIAAKVATNAAHTARVDAADVPTYLGPARFRGETAFRTSRPGVATGLAWTETGGDVLFIEAVLMPGGAGQLTLTGQLGSVMQESARAALSHVRQQARNLHLSPELLSRQDLHVHVPAGAIPKDGPSAGVTMATAIISAARGVPVNPEVAMTGEITLSGLVLPVGGIREKALAARRYGIKTMIVPALNEPDLEELPPDVRKDMTFVPVRTLEEALAVSLPSVVDHATVSEAGLGGTAAAAARPAHD